jgi:hypothetical protein
MDGDEPMTSNSKMAALAGGLVALAGPWLGGGLAHAQASAQPNVLMVHDADPKDLARVNGEGRLRKTDEEGTNEMGVVKFFADGTHALYVEMRTGALSTGETPVHNVQDACTPLELEQAADGSVGLVKGAGERFVTDNDGNEHRNGNKPELMPVNGGKNMLLMFNYQPDGGSDTIRYAKVLDASCKEVPVRDAAGKTQKQVQIMHKRNDDCDMHQSGEGPCDVASDAGGATHLTCWAGCNGNGRDDGWINDLTVTCASDASGNASSCTITKNFDMSLAQREERSRGRCSVADADPDTAICTWTEGNNQPQRDGTWIAAVDISAGGEQGEDASSRLLWKEQFDGRKQTADGVRTYSVRANQVRVLAPRADGSLERTDTLFMMTGDLDGGNRDNRKGGTYRAQQFAVLQATRAGLTTVVPEQDLSDLLVGTDATHLTVCPTVVGEGASLTPAISLLQGSQNGGGVQEPTVRLVGWDRGAGKLVDLGTRRAGGSYDRHLYSNYLGNNPGNQGRNFAGCTFVKNPFAGQNGSTAAYFLVHAMTGKSPANVDDAALKPSSYVSLLPVATIAAGASGPKQKTAAAAAAPSAPAPPAPSAPSAPSSATLAASSVATPAASPLTGARLALLAFMSLGLGAVVVQHWRVRR